MGHILVAARAEKGSAHLEIAWPMLRAFTRKSHKRCRNLIADSRQAGMLMKMRYMRQIAQRPAYEPFPDIDILAGLVAAHLAGTSLGYLKKARASDICKIWHFLRRLEEAGLLYRACQLHFRRCGKDSSMLLAGCELV
eukprot:6178649-Pleurochrysis_carterae.AAC.2